MSLCSLLLSLETPNDPNDDRSVVQQSKTIQAASKNSDPTARMRRLIRAFAVAHTTLLEISCSGSFIKLK